MHEKAIEAVARAIEGYCDLTIQSDWGSNNDYPVLENPKECAQAALSAYHAHLEAAGPTNAQVDAVAKALRIEGYSGDRYRTARHAIRAMISAAEGIDDASSN